MHRQLWLIITCTASRVTTTSLFAKHKASRVYSISLIYLGLLLLSGNLLNFNFLYFPSLYLMIVNSICTAELSKYILHLNRKKLQLSNSYYKDILQIKFTNIHYTKCKHRSRDSENGCTY